MKFVYNVNGELLPMTKFGVATPRKGDLIISDGVTYCVTGLAHDYDADEVVVYLE